MKKIIKIFCFMSIILLVMVNPVLAEEETDGTFIEVIESYVSALDQQDMEKLANLFVQEQQENMKNVFVRNLENKENKVGYLNIQNTTLKTVVEVEKEEYSPFCNMNLYESKYGDSIKVFLVGNECDVYHEDKYNYNGINYSVMVLVVEDTEVKILEDAAVPLQLYDQLLKKRTSSDLEAIQRARNVAYARTLGLVINDEGAILETNNDEHDCSEYIGTNIENYPVTVDNEYPHTRPTSIKVQLNDGTIKTVDFTLYCKNVLPNEWYPTWPTESLKAGALCVKMVGWFRVENPKYNGYDIQASDNDQTYIENSTTTATSAACNEVFNLSMHITIPQGGYLFYAAYLAGTTGVVGEQGSGTVLQWGTKALADGGSSYREILKYYYDGSTRTYGSDIGFYYTV